MGWELLGERSARFRISRSGETTWYEHAGRNSGRRQFAVVTGGTSGIGLSLAKQFAQNGFDVMISAETAGAPSSELQSLGANIQYVQADLSRPDGVERLADAIRTSGRPLDAIAINAGVGVGGDFRDTSLEAELALVDLNCRSTVHLAKRALEIMTERNQGRMLFTASIAALMPGPFEAVYAASKAFVYSFAEALRNELKDTDITVTALLPGPTETNLFHRAGMDDTKAGTQKKDDPDDVAKAGFDALMSGKDHVVAGAKNKMQAAMTGVIPQTVKAEMHRGLTEPGRGK